MKPRPRIPHAMWRAMSWLEKEIAHQNRELTLAGQETAAEISVEDRRLRSDLRDACKHDLARLQKAAEWLAQQE